MKKLLIGLTVSAAVFGGFVLAQSMTSGSAANQEATSTKKLITEQEAKDIALKEVNGTITEADYDGDEKRPHYEFEIQSNKEEVSIEVDAETGKVTITEREAAQAAEVNKTDKAVQATSSATKQKEVITKAEAINIAKSVAKGTVTKVELDHDDDDQTQKYELEFKDGNVEYDVEVDAYTGKVLEVDQDLED